MEPPSDDDAVAGRRLLHRRRRSLPASRALPDAARTAGGRPGQLLSVGRLKPGVSFAACERRPGSSSASGCSPPIRRRRRDARPRERVGARDGGRFVAARAGAVVRGGRRRAADRVRQRQPAPAGARDRSPEGDRAARARSARAGRAVTRQLTVEAAMMAVRRDAGRPGDRTLGVDGPGVAAACVGGLVPSVPIPDGGAARLARCCCSPAGCPSSWRCCAGWCRRSRSSRPDISRVLQAGFRRASAARSPAARWPGRRRDGAIGGTGGGVCPPDSEPARGAAGAARVSNRRTCSRCSSACRRANTRSRRRSRASSRAPSRTCARCPVCNRPRSCARCRSAATAAPSGMPWKASRCPIRADAAGALPPRHARVFQGDEDSAAEGARLHRSRRPADAARLRDQRDLRASARGRVRIRSASSSPTPQTVGPITVIGVVGDYQALHRYRAGDSAALRGALPGAADLLVAGCAGLGAADEHHQRRHEGDLGRGQDQPLGGHANRHVSKRRGGSAKFPAAQHPRRRGERLLSDLTSYHAGLFYKIIHMRAGRVQPIACCAARSSVGASGSR